MSSGEHHFFKRSANSGSRLCPVLFASDSKLEEKGRAAHNALEKVSANRAEKKTLYRQALNSRKILNPFANTQE